MRSMLVKMNLNKRNAHNRERFAELLLWLYLKDFGSQIVR